MFDEIIKMTQIMSIWTLLWSNENNYIFLYFDIEIDDFEIYIMNFQNIKQLQVKFLLLVRN